MVDSMVDEVLDCYVKATGRDGTQKREELVNMRPGELRRSLERWQARAKDMQHLQDKKEHAWDLYSRVPNFRLKNKENFEEDFKHRAVYDGKVNERKLQEWIDEMQPKVHAAERQFEIRDRKRESVDGVGGLQFPQATSMGEDASAMAVRLLAQIIFH